MLIMNEEKRLWLLIIADISTMRPIHYCVERIIPSKYFYLRQSHLKISNWNRYFDSPSKVWKICLIVYRRQFCLLKMIYSSLCLLWIRLLDWIIVMLLKVAPSWKDEKLAPNECVSMWRFILFGGMEPRW